VGSPPFLFLKFNFNEFFCAFCETSATSAYGCRYWASYPYIASICGAYFFSTNLRFSFIVGVSSSSSADSCVSSRKNFLICSTRANLVFTPSITPWISA
jgi:hypothetical protein